MFSFLRRSSAAASAGWHSVCLYPGRIDVARVRRGAGKPCVEALESWERKDADEAALQRLSKHYGLKRNPCTTLLAGNEYQLLQVARPTLQPKQRLSEALRDVVKEMVETPIEHVTLDGVDIVTEAYAPGRPWQCYAVAANNAVIAPRVQLFDRANINLTAIDIPDFAQRNIAALAEDKDRGLAFLAFGETEGLLTFTFNGELYLSRRIEMGFRQLMTDDMDRRSGLFDRIGLELQRSLDNFDRAFGFIPVNRVLIGPQPESQPLSGFLADYLSIKTEILDLADVLDFSAVPELAKPERQGQCLLSIGAALRDLP